jgi:hypothetical protein
VVGWSNCTRKYYQNPTLFYVSRTDSGLSRCHVWEDRHPRSGQYDYFRVSDLNANSYWGSYFNQEELQPNGIDMDFSRGFNGIGTERGHSNDSCYARWSDLQEYHDSNGWTTWNDPSPGVDRDPDCYRDVIDINTVSVHQ